MTEILFFHFISGVFSGWNDGEGCCAVNSKLYPSFVPGLTGMAGQEVDGTTATNAAHHIMLELEQANQPRFQRWGYAEDLSDPTETPVECANQEGVPVPRDDE